MEEITKSDPPKKIDDPLSRIISSSSTDGVVVKTRCKICNSVNRKTIESMFTNGQSLFALKEFMDKNGYGIWWKPAAEFDKFLAEQDEVKGKNMKEAGLIK